MTDILKSRGMGKWRIYSDSAYWIKKTHFKVYGDSSQYKRNKVRMSEVEDQVPVIIWIVSNKIDPRSGLYCN
jgi:hypothetical protein